MALPIPGNATNYEALDQSLAATECAASTSPSPTEVHEAPLKYGEEQLPDWAYNHDVAVMRKRDCENYVVGPAIPKAWRALGFRVAIYFISPCLAYNCIGCPEEGLAKYPWWLPVLMSSGMLLLLHEEWQVMKFSIIPYTVRAGSKGFTLLGCPVNFHTWFATVTIRSIIGHSSFITNGLFFAKALKTHMCEHEESQASITSIWRQVMDQSFLHDVPLLRSMDFWGLALATWLTTTLLFVYALMNCVPITADLKTKEKVAYHIDESRCAKYDTLMTKLQNHGVCLQVLAECCKMYSVTDQHWKYKLQKGWTSRSSLKQMPRFVWRFAIFHTFTECVQINMQSSTLAIVRAMSDSEDVDWQTVVSIVLIVSISLSGMCSDMVLVVKVFYRTNTIESDDPEDQQFAEEVYGTVGRARICMLFYLTLFMLIALLTLGLITSALAKVYFATLVCHNGVWNLKGGCVEL